MNQATTEPCTGLSLGHGEDLRRVHYTRRGDELVFSVKNMFRIFKCENEDGRTQYSVTKETLERLVAELYEAEDKKETAESVVAKVKNRVKKPPAGKVDLTVNHCSEISTVSCKECGEKRIFANTSHMSLTGGSEWKYVGVCKSCEAEYRITDLYKKAVLDSNDLRYYGPDPDKLGFFYTEDGFKLSEEQFQAVRHLVKTDSQFTILTGVAGSGKSVIIRVLKEHYGLITAATTGKAALNVGGCTIDSLLSMNREKWTVRKRSSLDWMMRKLKESRCMDAVIVDEWSMGGKGMANYVQKIANEYNIRFIFVCDYGQAQPVKDACVLESSLMSNCDIIKLQECHRQSQGPFLEALNKVRVGVVDEQVEEVFKGCVLPNPPDEDHFIRMFATNNATRAYNSKRLRELVSKTGAKKWRLKAKFQDRRDDIMKMRYPRKPAYIASRIEDSRVADGDEFAVGCQIVFTTNDSGFGSSREYVNGDTAEVVDAWCGKSNVKDVDFCAFGGPSVEVTCVKVLMHRTGKEFDLTIRAFDFKSSVNEIESTVTGFPFKLGYALTIHKAQGMTVDHAWVDMKTIMLHPEEGRMGLAYVALSRSRTLEGVKISSWIPNAVVCNRRLLPYM